MTENVLYEQVAQYLNLKHSGLLYHFDLAGVNNQSKYTRSLYGRLNERAWPDLFIAKPSDRANGLFIELKREGTRLRKRNGEYASEHIEEQAVMLERLENLGYAVGFAVGFDEAVEIIEAYMAGNYPAVSSSDDGTVVFSRVDAR